MATWVEACKCVYVCVEPNSTENNASIKPQWMEGAPDLPPKEKVKLLNINSGSGHHADYATITILHTASMDPTPVWTHFFSLSHSVSVLTRPFGIKTKAETQPCRRPMQTSINTFSHNRPAITTLYEGLSINMEPLRPLLPINAPWKYELIWQKCECHAIQH